MTPIGYHASHEQFSPSELLRHLQAAAEAGFASGMCSDHFHPWSENQGHSGFAWAWLGTALQATPLDLGVVNAPIFRYHPALIAQAAATLTEMFPGRFWLAVGSGEAINEGILGRHWPLKETRNAMLREAVDIIRALWNGEEVTHHGLITVERARLYSLPAEAPRLFAAALTPETAHWAGEWADGLITVSSEPETQQRLIDAFREGGGEGKPLYLQVKLSYATDEATALAGAHDQWRTNALPGELSQNLCHPRQFELATAHLRPEDMHRSVRISASPARHVDWLQGDIAQGFDRLYLHNVNREQRTFIETFASEVLPQLR
ncbi:LLM class F420-dependent oxidoreductase [Pseudomonas sp. PIC25]|uniref:TIGR03885 family FMN-dependent LLM class oxidoreductase n=1 Tax=Pseudomonas sp. PIC25 TaxID=1958773 RepID=UPI000BAB7E2E|nr:TIGR03885 family FMN-dependent LLM class oxidoreductase [Pseudomonas sp. PIC25]PAU56583.1 LLM class F420-dependent oxidoreductase [Pseudomonas sp. PIC25]